jgi:hypothetical protein
MPKIALQAQKHSTKIRPLEGSEPRRANGTHDRSPPPIRTTSVKQGGRQCKSRISSRTAGRLGGGLITAFAMGSSVAAKGEAEGVGLVQLRAGTCPSGHNKCIFGCLL